MMINSVTISGYRGFHRLDMSHLRRVNLLVGPNNSGKTSVLEALFLLAQDGDPQAFWRILSRRGERFEVGPTTRMPPDSELDISHLFCGHELHPGSHIHISTKNGAPDRQLNIRLQEMKPEEARAIDDEDEESEGLIVARLALHLSGTPRPVASIIPLSRQGGIRSSTLDRNRRVRGRRAIEPASAQYVTTESLSVPELSSLWNDIVLTDSEELVLSALRFLEPRIERIAAISTGPYYYSNSGRGGFKVKLSDSASPIPIGSLGDGIWRMLAMSIALMRAKGGFLLIDEIDTGLHYSVMSDMWNLIIQTSKMYNVQVFATTHSYDCIQSISEICHQNETEHEEISIQKIEHGRRHAVPYSESEIRIAAQRKIEMR